jgi:hypothetical protein
MITNLIIATIAIFILNIPFGYWRANVKKFSFQWFLAVHIPVPIIIALRILVSIGFAWYTYVFFVGAFFLGQSFGSLLHKSRKKKGELTSSCLIMDLFKNKE